MSLEDYTKIHRSESRSGENPAGVESQSDTKIKKNASRNCKRLSEFGEENRGPN